MTLIIREEAARRLGVWPKTLDRWVKAAGLKYRDDPFNKHLKCLTEEQVETLAFMRDRSLAETPEQLRARISELEAEVARLRYAPVRVSQPAERPPVPRVAPQYSERSELPQGLVTVAGFLMAHGMDENQRTTWTKAMHEGKIAVVSYQGEGLGWKHGSTYARHAFDAAGRRQAWERWHERDWWVECDDCAVDGHAVQQG